MSEPMCRLGADVTGIDASEKYKNCRDSLKKNNLNINYLNKSPENECRKMKSLMLF